MEIARNLPLSLWNRAALQTGEKERAAGRGSLPEAAALRAGGKDPADERGCETCESRTYQDGSNDPGVSFKNPTKIAPGAVAGAVKSHELEHVYRERFKAESEGRRILMQNVTLHTGICPECGRVYISGGTTRTVTRRQADPARYQVGLPGSGGGAMSLTV